MTGEKILIIDDAKDLTRAMTVRLKHEGYQVEVAYDAVQGMTSAVRVQPDLIILDLSLPGGHGLRVLQNLKDLSHTSQTPVVIFTAHGKASRKKAEMIGAAAYLTKPCESSVLLKTIRNILDQTVPRDGHEDMLG